MYVKMYVWVKNFEISLMFVQNGSVDNIADLIKKIPWCWWSKTHSLAVRVNFMFRFQLKFSRPIEIEKNKLSPDW